MTQTTKLRQLLNVMWSERNATSFDAWIADRKAAGASWRSIEREIEELIGIKVSHVTLINWYGDTIRGAA